MRKGRLVVGLVIILTGLFILFGNLGLIIANKVMLQLLFLALGLVFAFYGIKGNKLLTSGIGSAIVAMALVKLLPLLRITSLGWDQLWPFLFIFIGFAWIWIYMKNNRGTILFWGIVSFCLGVLFLLSTLDALRYSPGELITQGWPILIIAAGIYILGRKNSAR